MLVEFNAGRFLRRAALGILVGLAGTSAFYGVSYAGQSGSEINKRNAERFLSDGAFNPKDLSKLYEGTFRVTVRRPWSLNEELRKHPEYTGLTREEETIVADRALGNALRAATEQAGCPVISSDRMDAPAGVHPQFGTFSVITRC